VSARQVQVDGDALRSAATRFVAAAGRLDGPAGPVETGPSWQPSSAAVLDVTAATGHVAAECVQRLVDYADKLAAAATAYTATDASSTARVAATVQSD
jgi:hypothetical protein